MESAKIVGLSIVAAVIYGIVHDQVTAHLCVEYFSVFHPPVFPTYNPTLLAFGWGVLATWWMGLFLGLLLAASARVGSEFKIGAKELAKPIIRLLLVMATIAIVCGTSAYFLFSTGKLALPEGVAEFLPASKHARFMAAYAAHTASYATGTLGGLALSAWVVFRRVEREKRGWAMQKVIKNL